MPLPIETEITAVYVPRGVSLPSAGLTAQEVQDIRDDIAALQGHGLADHPNVDRNAFLVAPNGHAIVKGPDGRWTTAPIAAGFIAEARDDLGNSVPNASVVFPFHGLKVSPNPSFPTNAYIEPNYGTSPNTVAEGNHTHTLYQPLKFTFGSDVNTPLLSSGTRELVSAGVSLPSGIATVIDVTGKVHVQGANDLARGHILITIDGNTSSSAELGGREPFTYEWGVNGLWEWEHFRTLTGDGTPKTVSMSLQRTAGDLDIIGGWITVRRYAAR